MFLVPEDFRDCVCWGATLQSQVVVTVNGGTRAMSIATAVAAMIKCNRKRHDARSADQAETGSAQLAALTWPARRRSD
jgi:hypothetical protein